MNRHRAPSDRVLSFLLRALLPFLDHADRDDAVLTFRALADDARRGGRRRYLTFLGREARALLATAARERRGGPGSPGHRTGGPGRRWFPRWLDPLRQDLRYALRNLARAPGFVLVSVLSLAFAIAVSTVVFSTVNAALLRPVPHLADQDRLVRVFTGTRRYGRGPSSYPDFEDYREMSETLTDLAAIGSKHFSVGPVSWGTRQVWGLEVSDNYFQLLGIPLARGRGFVPEDIAAGGKVAVIGHNTWKTEFDGSSDVLGRQIQLNGQPYTVVGVGPEGMVGLDGPLLLEIVVPIMEFREERGRLALNVVGRLKEGATVPQAQAEFAAIGRHLSETYPDHWNPEGGTPRGLSVLTGREARIPEGAPLAAILGGVAALVGLILLIACSNVANLLLTRAFKRRSEIAVRCAIGAPAKRVFGQLLVENLLLFGSAGAVGLLGTHWLASLLGSGWVLIPPPGADISVDVRVVCFALAVSLGTGLTFGMVPALQVSRLDLLPALKGLAPALRFRFLGVRNLLVGAQVGGSMVLVLVTILLVQSLSRVRDRDLGFDPSGVSILSLDLSHRDYGEDDGRQFHSDLMARTAVLPGVSAVGLASWVPLEGGSTVFGGLEPEGYQASPQEYLSATSAVVTPGYLELARMRLLRGRDFGEEDAPGSREVILVNQSFVDRFWPGEDGVGKRVGFGDDLWREVVGVVADVPYRDLVSEVGPHIWFPLSQHYRSEMVLHVRAAGDPRDLLPLMRRQVADLDPNLPVIRADAMENLTANGTQPQRLLGAALGATGFFTLCLAMLGIYGVVGYSVSQRTREMGLRMALGAEPMRVVRLVIKEGLVLSLIGLVPGLFGAAAAGQVLRALLLGLNPLDPLSFALGVGFLVLAVMGASLAPGIRASRAHPMKSLRTE
ncbi:MAG: ABC transporter permease [Longimicrobiales bacterium]